MLGKIIGAYAGKKVADHTAGIGGTTGAVLGAVAVPIVRRFGLPGLVAAAAGGYVLKRYNEAQDRKVRTQRARTA